MLMSREMRKKGGCSLPLACLGGGVFCSPPSRGTLNLNRSVHGQHFPSQGVLWYRERLVCFKGLAWVYATVCTLLITLSLPT